MTAPGARRAGGGRSVCVSCVLAIPIPADMPRACFGGRYPAASRWVDLLERKTGWEVINAGENGREIPKGPVDLPEELDLLIPPPMKPGAWVAGKRLLASSGQLASRYRELAQRLGVRFADSAPWGVGLAFDGVHFSEEGHKAFAAGVSKAI